MFDLKKLIRLKDFYDLVITFRYVKLYSGWRQFISWVYNTIIRLVFSTYYRDISTGLRLVLKDVIDEISLQSSSPFIGAELTIKIMLKGYRVGEVGIQTFPREFGHWRLRFVKKHPGDAPGYAASVKRCFQDTTIFRKTEKGSELSREVLPLYHDISTFLNHDVLTFRGNHLKKG